MNIKIAYTTMTGIILSILMTNIFAAGPVIFDDIDTDADGCISKEEASVRDDMVKNFKMIDKNKDGSICVDEYTVYENKGKLSPEEVEIPEVGAAPAM